MATLYHFTSHVWWHYIRAEGLARGEVPVNETTVLDHPNLTADPLPGAQTWAGGAMNKTAVRITVQVPEGDGRLVSWRSLTERYGMGRRYYRELNEAGGWGAKNWHIFLGHIPPDWFTDVDIFAEPATFESRLLAVVDRFPTSEEFRRGLMVKGPGDCLYFSDDRLDEISLPTVGLTEHGSGVH